MNLRIAPSVLSADLANLGRDVAAVEAGGADLIHVDVMDGHFVPNLTMGVPVVRALRRVARVPLDVHLMVSNPDASIASYVDAGAAIVTVHAEVLPHLHRTVAAIRECGARAGVAINPATPVSVLEEIIGDVDLVLVMSVDPGFSGQRFIPGVLEKIRRVRRLLDERSGAAAIEVDGGVDLTNIGDVVRAGATIVVAGSAVFGQAAPGDAVRALRAAARTVVDG